MKHHVSDVVLVLALVPAFMLGEWRIRTGEHDDAAFFSTGNCHDGSLQHAGHGNADEAR
jgi:hypothetical protein